MQGGFNISDVFVSIGARRGGQPGAVAPHPWNLKIMASYAVSVQNTLKFLLASSALASITLKVSLKRRKNRENFRLRLRRTEKRPILSVPEILHPSEKIPTGSHASFHLNRYRFDG